MLATADQMEEARRRNVNANDLAMKPLAYDPEHLPARAGFELKVDGIGLLDVNGNVQTLEAVDLECARHLEGELSALRAAFGVPMVLHGEYIEPGGFEATLAAFRRRQGEAGCAILWDAVPLKVWHGFETSMPLVDRRAQLEAAFAAVRPRMLSLNSLQPINDPDPAAVVAGALEKTLEAGFEGLVIKDMDSPYRRGPSRYWMKAKGCETLDVPVQGVRVDDSGRLQSIIVTVEGRPAIVGAGFSEALRLEPAEFVTGRIVEIRHIGKTRNGCLKGAAFVRFRDDKETGA